MSSSRTLGSGIGWWVLVAGLVLAGEVSVAGGVRGGLRLGGRPPAAS